MVIKFGLGKRKLLLNVRVLIFVGDIIEFLFGKMFYKLILELIEDELVYYLSCDV